MFHHLPFVRMQILSTDGQDRSRGGLFQGMISNKKWHCQSYHKLFRHLKHQYTTIIPSKVQRLTHNSIDGRCNASRESNIKQHQWLESILFMIEYENSTIRFEPANKLIICLDFMYSVGCLGSNFWMK